ncbi:hypothetical protein RSK20926_10539 [Roseobacter sp. SK209-2-6]|uniref:hypothetical protein n=1 Tax=Roseobacter sp. SK209-2-6 TaxID=388739 RepID=UPI0000F3C685|nr:hypothetical protein [Roseobacter sp. SK209-2-6]EBA18149.1 hypothetical protein RSK20926_10539 [Roseobacter sp. SK209-2-6]
MALALTQTRNSTSVLSLLFKPFTLFGDLLISIGEANTRGENLRRLMALDDAELAERGLKRDELVHQVYTDSYYL